jgi:hypothetical protein
MRATWHIAPLDWRQAPAVTQLGALLGRRDPRLLLLDLWDWSKRQTKGGLVAGPRPVAAVEGGAGWTGTRGAFVDAALATGWLERDGEALRVVDWRHVLSADFSKATVSADDALAASRAKERAKKREQRKKAKGQAGDKPESSPGQWAGQAGDTAGTGRGQAGDTRDNSPLSAPASARATNTHTDTGSDGEVPPAAVASEPEQPLLALTPPVARPKREPKAPRPKVVDPAVEAAREARSAEQRAVQADMDRWRDAYCEATGTPKEGPNGFEWTGGAVKHFRLARAKAIAKGGSVDTVIEATRALVADPFWRVKPPEAVLTEKNQTEGANRARAGPGSRGGAAAGGFGDHPGGEFDLVTGEHIPAHIALERERAKRAAREAGNGTAA